MEIQTKQLQSKLRNYEINTPQYYLYKDMHKYQTVDYVRTIYKKYEVLSNDKMNIKDVLLDMNNYIDPSDPDVDIENSIHAYQTAERIRKKHPLNKEFQLIGLIPDLGKILFKFNEPNWSVVGDTYVVGCKFPESIIYYETLKDNPDYNDNRYNSDKYYNDRLLEPANWGTIIMHSVTGLLLFAGLWLGNSMV